MSRPAPSESLGSQPTAPRWVRLRNTVRPCSTIECDFLPLIWATKPTPQASCSLAGWYRPWGSFRITLGSDDWVLPAAKFSYSALREAGFLTMPAFPCCLKCLEQPCEAAIQGTASTHLGGKPRERVIDCTGRYVGAKQCHPQPLQQNEMDAAAPCFLVEPHQLLHARRRNPSYGCRKSRALEQRTHASGVGLRKIAELTRQVGRHHYPGRHGLAVQPSPVAEARFNGVAERVAEVEERAQAALALVTADDFGFDRDRAHHSLFQHFRIPRQQAIEIGLEPAEERRVADQAVLDHFGKPRAQLALGQGFQRSHVGHDQLRLMKGADHVLSERVIDRGLAADRRIHLCEQRGRDLNEGHAALIGGGGEPRQIPDYPTPQGDECGITRASLLEQRIENPIKGAPVLVFLAVGNDDADHLDVLTGQRSGNAFEIERRHRRVGDDGHLPLRKERGNKVGPIEKPGTDVNGIGALPERYAESLHASSNRASTCASKGPIPWRPVSITKSATSR